MPMYSERRYVLRRDQRDYLKAYTLTDTDCQVVCVPFADRARALLYDDALALAGLLNGRQPHTWALEPITLTYARD